ncbi:hypothetical protein K438DRAFT_1986403 [Mycena galopus ATCC 62051]|nr:hypothetical protein K438DRAFT_1986403 [Mycena galopus ATCC 62051]
MPTDLPGPAREAVGAAPGRCSGYLSRRGTGKLNASRKEEDLQLKDSVLRRTHLPLLVSFLLTSDIIPASTTEEDPVPLPLALSAVPAGTRPRWTTSLPSSPTRKSLLPRLGLEVSKST